MFEISAKKGLCYVICGSEVKTSDLAAHFHTILALQIRFCNTANTIFYSNVQRTFKDAKLSQPYLRGHM